MGRLLQGQQVFSCALLECRRLQLPHGCALQRSHAGCTLRHAALHSTKCAECSRVEQDLAGTTAAAT